MSLLDIVTSRRPSHPQPGLELHIEIALSGELRRPDAVYRLARTSPPLAAEAAGVVNKAGDIDLTAVQPLNDANPLTLITFQLTGKLTFEGRAYPIVFRRPAPFAFRVRRKGGGRPRPGLFRAFFPDPRNPAVLAVLDENDDCGEYTYCLGIRAKGAFGLWGTLDPSIINR